MTKQIINPDTVYESTQYGFSHAVKSDGVTTIHCAGQVAWDKDYNLVGGDDIAAQARHALANVKRVLEAAGAPQSTAPGQSLTAAISKAAAMSALV